MSNRVPKEHLEWWNRHCAAIQGKTGVSLVESEKEKQDRIKTFLRDDNYRAFFEYYFPHYAKVPIAEGHEEFAGIVASQKKIDVIWECYRGYAKSTHATMGVPIWLMFKGELKFMACISDTEKKAAKLINCIRAEFEYNERLRHDFGDLYNNGSWAETDFTTKTGVTFYALGIGQSPRGLKEAENRPDYIVLDDADTKERCNNPRRVDDAVEWVDNDLRGCFDSADYSYERFVVTNNRIAKKSILTGLIKALKGAVHRTVNALDENDQSTWEAKASTAYWHKKREKKTMRAWETEYMNNPIQEGKIFKAEWMQKKEMPDLSAYESLLTYSDLSYTQTGDKKACLLIGRPKANPRHIHLIRGFCKRADITEAVKWLYDLEEDAKAQGVTITHYIEGNFIQSQFLDDFDMEGDERGWYMSIISDLRSKGDKFNRIEKISSFFFRGYFFYNALEEESEDMQEIIAQFLAFEKGSGANDDAPDAFEGGLWYLNKPSVTSKTKPGIVKRMIQRVTNW